MTSQDHFISDHEPCSSIDHSHRMVWIEQRLHEVTACFSISIYGYAVMNNHQHGVVHIDVVAAQCWSDDEFAHDSASCFHTLIKLKPPEKPPDTH